jgi:hypothetical protein
LWGQFWDKIGNLKTIKNHVVMLAVATVLGLAQVGAQAGDATAVKAQKSRPERPEKPKGTPVERPNLTEIRDVVKSFQDQKKEFIQQQKDAAKTTREDVRQQVKENVVDSAVTSARKESKESLKEAKELAKEQSRKLAEEAAETLKKRNKD